MEILIENRNYSVAIKQDKTFIIDYKLIKGDQGEPGSDAPIAPHLLAFPHGDIHQHGNRSVLDGISYETEKGLCYNQTFAIDHLDTYPTIIEYTGTDLGYGSHLTGSRLLKYENGFRIVEERIYAIEYPGNMGEG